MSEVSLQHGMTRQMAVSQSMQTGMQILQASALELRQIIRQALETNPMLEELPDASPEALEDGPDGDAWNEREDGWNEFTAEGRLLDSFRSTPGLNRRQLPTGIYIVRVGATVRKVAIR